MADNTKMIALERSLAYEYSASIIEGCCAHASIAGAEGDYYNLDDVDELAAAEVDEAADYLDWRGLLLHLADTPHIVCIADEDAADHPLDTEVA